jgi:prepilin-type N-terminal cleavage/methylation domain-containing protein
MMKQTLHDEYITHEIRKCPPPSPSPSKEKGEGGGEKGVTLIELLIALVLSAILIAGIYRAFIQQQKSYATQEQVADMQQNVRVAINRMMREIRMAGFGNVQDVLPVTFQGGRTYPNIVNPDLPNPGEFTIVSAIGGSASLIALPSSGGLLPNQIQVSSLAEFDISTNIDRRYISIGGLESHVITAIDVPNRVLTLNTNVGRLYKIVPIGSTLVYAIRAISYQIDNSSGRPILRRDENIGGNFQPLADNIEAIEFRNPDGSTPLNPNSLSMQVGVTARTERPDPDLQKVGDGYRRRIFNSLILQRNRGL